jgi:uncharacterized protein (DUF2062 family)
MAYIKLVKKARSFLRGKFMRRFPWLVKILKPLFKRTYWEPTPHRIALGFSIGIFFAFAMLVFPMQMLCASITCLYFKGNLPIALGACWVSNPVTVFPLAIGMVWVGEQMDKLGLPIPVSSEFNILDLMVVDFWHFVLGCVTSGVVLSLVSYPLVLCVSMMFPRRRKSRDPQV